MIPSNDCDVDSTPAERLKSGRPSTSRGKSSGPMATLRVKTFEGTNHIIKMRYEDSLTTLRSYLQLGFLRGWVFWLLRGTVFKRSVLRARRG